VVLPLTTVTRREGLIKTTSQLWPTCVLGITDAGGSSFRIKGWINVGHLSDTRFPRHTYFNGEQLQSFKLLRLKKSMTYYESHSSCMMETWLTDRLSHDYLSSPRCAL